MTFNEVDIRIIYLPLPLLTMYTYCLFIRICFQFSEIINTKSLEYTCMMANYFNG